MSHLQLVCSAVFPWGYAEDEQKCWEVYKAFDKSKLPRDVVVYFDLVHLSVALSSTKSAWLSRSDSCGVQSAEKCARASWVIGWSMHAYSPADATARSQRMP